MSHFEIFTRQIPIWAPLRRSTSISSVSGVGRRRKNGCLFAEMMQVTDCFAPSEKATLSLEPRKVIGDSNTTMYL